MLMFGPAQSQVLASTYIQFERLILSNSNTISVVFLVKSVILLFDFGPLFDSFDAQIKI